MSSVFGDINVRAWAHNSNRPQLVDNSYIMIVMRKLKSMQTFSFAINKDSLHSKLQAKLLNVQLCTCKRCKNMCSVKDFAKSVEWKISAYVAHVQQQ